MSDDITHGKGLEYYKSSFGNMPTEILRLRAENEKLRAALAPFVDAGHFKVVTNVGTTEENNYVSIRVKESDLRTAAALKETE